MHQYKKSLFIFRRDLRLEDNTGLIAALEQSQHVIPAFIFTPEQIDENRYKSDRCIKFMVESLRDLGNQLSKKRACLNTFKGHSIQVVDSIIKNEKIEAVFVNRDYTPYSIHRDEQIKQLCRQQQIKFFSFDDLLLHPPEATLKKDGTPYSIFTPYFRNASKIEIPPPIQNRFENYTKAQNCYSFDLSQFNIELPTTLIGGRQEGLQLLSKLGNLKDYATLRDYPALDYTTHLSPYLKFNVFSPREVYHAIKNTLGDSHELIRSLHWRDFFTSIAFYFPHVFGHAFHQKYNAIKWCRDKHSFSRWCEGSTGFPIVDAGMRELNATGIMHNRVRMIVGSFLVKDLHIDWRWGEQYFARTLIDYDPAVNNGNWQWVASTGCDAQPYFRIFNPWSQQKRFDPDCIYIKKWIPELDDVPVKVIHAWEDEKHHQSVINYPPPMLNHSEEAKQTKTSFNNIF